MSNTTPAKGPCARLFYEDKNAGMNSMVDICRLRAGHEGDHEGRHRGVHWVEDLQSATGRRITGYDEHRP